MAKKRPSLFFVPGAVGAMLVLFGLYADGPVAADNSKQGSDQDPSCGDVFAINAQNELLLLNVKLNRGPLYGSDQRHATGTKSS